MRRPRLLDLFCGAGGCAAGYVRAGFDVVGVDHQPQPRYLQSGAIDFLKADALMLLECLADSDGIMSGHGYGHADGDGASGSFGYVLSDFAVIHASPPCQAYSAMARAVPTKAPDLIEKVRRRLSAAGKPYVMENVEGAPMLGHVVTLCGTMFGPRVRRHRLFEIGAPLMLWQTDCRCRHGVVTGRLIGHRTGGKAAPGRTKPPHATDSHLREAIGVPWMTTKEARQAIPPAYTEFIGRQLLAAHAGAARVRSL